MCVVKVIVQDDDSTSRVCDLLHVDNGALPFADPLNCPCCGYDVEGIFEPVRISAISKRKFHSGAQDSRKIGMMMIALQSASIEDPWIGAVRLLAHRSSFIVP